MRLSDYNISRVPRKHQPIFLFVPDISGFTRFVTSAEIEHSNHIIRELLEALIDNNDLGLEISEVEGDAVLFFKFGEMPGIEPILRQVKKMFTAFHAHLLAYEHDRICNCGACTGANDLTLKFVIYQGMAAEIKIKDRMKLIGPDIILVHKLLKNDIPQHEYALLGGDFKLDVVEDKNYPWVRFMKGFSDYQNWGKVGYDYTLLNDLYQEVERPHPSEGLPQLKDPITNNTVINAPWRLVYTIMTDIGQKELWLANVRKVLYDKDEVTKVGSTHQCVLPFMTLSVRMEDHKRNEQSFSFVEKGSSKLLSTLYTIVHGEAINDESTSVTIESYLVVKPWARLFMGNRFKKMIGEQMAASLEFLKKLCERRTRQWEKDPKITFYESQSHM